VYPALRAGATREFPVLVGQLELLNQVPCPESGDGNQVASAALVGRSKLIDPIGGAGRQMSGIARVRHALVVRPKRKMGGPDARCVRAGGELSLRPPPGVQSFS
jgi:hypothetical protein